MGNNASATNRTAWTNDPAVSSAMALPSMGQILAGDGANGEARNSPALSSFSRSGPATMTGGAEWMPVPRGRMGFASRVGEIDRSLHIRPIRLRSPAPCPSVGGGQRACPFAQARRACRHRLDRPCLVFSRIGRRPLFRIRRQPRHAAHLSPHPRGDAAQAHGRGKIGMRAKLRTCPRILRPSPGSVRSPPGTRSRPTTRSPS